jgi:hypothetical protein
MQKKTYPRFIIRQSEHTPQFPDRTIPETRAQLYGAQQLTYAEKLEQKIDQELRRFHNDR